MCGQGEQKWRVSDPLKLLALPAAASAPHLYGRKSDAVQRKAAYSMAGLRHGVLCCSVYVQALSWGTERWEPKEKYRYFALFEVNDVKVWCEWHIRPSAHAYFRDSKISKCQKRLCFVVYCSVNTKIRTRGITSFRFL